MIGVVRVIRGHGDTGLDDGSGRVRLKRLKRCLSEGFLFVGSSQMHGRVMIQKRGADDS